MKVLIDFSQIPCQKVGVGVYACETFKRILTVNSKDDFYILLQDDDEEILKTFPKAHKILVPSNFFRIFIFRFLLEQIYIPYLCLKYKVKIIHSLHYSFPLLCFWVKRVVTIHDLTFFIYPEMHTFIKRYFFRVFIILACRVTDAIICVSNSTKKDLFKYVSVVKAKVYVVPLAASILKVNNLDISFVKEKFSIRKDYILFIGTLEPRKNVCNLLKSFGTTNHLLQNYQLVLVGKKGWYYQSIFDIIHQLGLDKSVIITGFVTEKEKYCLLSAASVFVYPSIYEGFGLPVLEAMSYGIPTVTSNVSSLPEVAGDAALLVNPNEIEELSHAIDHILTNSSLQTEMRLRSIKQANKYSWEKTAKLTMEVYSFCNYNEFA